MNIAQGYLKWFGMQAVPFSIAPDPGFLYPSPAHREAIAHLRYGLEREGGFILLTGEVGTGKTTLSRMLLDQLPSRFDVAYILCTSLSTHELLASICDDLGIEYADRGSLKAGVDALNAALLSRHASGRQVLLVFEEAQSLSPDVLEFLRMLTNLETDKQKLLHILLIGQPELLETLAAPSLRQLDQRIVARYHLRPLSLDEINNYVAHRLGCAGVHHPLFEARAIKRLHHFSEGIPRRANLIGERALLGAYGAGKRTIDAKVVNQAAAEISSQANRPRRQWRLVSLAAVILVSVGALSLIPDPKQTMTEKSERALSSVEGDTRAIDSEFDSTEQKPDTTASLEQPAAHLGALSVMTPRESLLSSWGVAAESDDDVSLCAQADAAGLRCVYFDLIQMASLKRYNRPALVELESQAGGKDLYLMTEITPDGVELISPEGVKTVSEDVFLQEWNRSALVLWRPPTGFSGALSMGDPIPPELSGWMQRALASWSGSDLIPVNLDYETALVERVMAFQRSQQIRIDGVLGEETAMMMSLWTDPLPVLVERN